MLDNPAPTPPLPPPQKNSFSVNGPLIKKKFKNWAWTALQMKKNKKQKKDQTITTCWCESTVPKVYLKI